MAASPTPRKATTPRWDRSSSRSRTRRRSTYPFGPGSGRSWRAWSCSLHAGRNRHDRKPERPPLAMTGLEAERQRDPGDRVRHVRFELSTRTMVALLLVGALTIPTLVSQGAALLEHEPALRARLADQLAGSHLSAPLAKWLRGFKYDASTGTIGATAFAYSVRVFTAAAYGVSALFLALYIMIDLSLIHISEPTRLGMISY